jgi:hypothetical protein
MVQLHFAAAAHSLHAAASASWHAGAEKKYISNDATVIQQVAMMQQ